MSDDLVVWRDELLRCARAGVVPQRPASPFSIQPILIIAGTCRDETGAAWGEFIQTLEKMLSTFSGRIISGGTRVGVCGEVGRISAETPKENRNWISLGYLPRSTSPDLIDNRYDELIYTTGKTFSEIEPLQYWTDILAAGISPNQVVFLRHGGRELSDYEEALLDDICLVPNRRPPAE